MFTLESKQRTCEERLKWRLQCFKSCIEKVLIIFETLTFIDNHTSPFDLFEEGTAILIDGCFVRRDNDMSSQITSIIRIQLIIVSHLSSRLATVICNYTKIRSPFFYLPSPIGARGIGGYDEERPALKFVNSQSD
jgi:hypothetical protein